MKKNTKKSNKNGVKMAVKKADFLKIPKASAHPVTPLGDRVLIREIITEEKEIKTASGIIIPVTETGDKGSKKGVVVSVGLGRYDDGKIIPVSVKVGDKVLFQWGDKIVIEGLNNDNDHYLVREAEILAIVK